jgi:tRNA-specific 2-thiouridylase
VFEELKAISLFSGGLDSQLAVRLLQEQGIEVLGFNFVTPFFGGTQRIEAAARQLGIELVNLDVTDDYIPGVLQNPVYGYGKNMNPCIDCHAFMFRTAGNLMQRYDASFLVTGEVLGQRPMSQNRSALNAVDKLSGYRGWIVRPLSAKLLPPTQPEERGWIDREKLLDIQGRGRTRQMELAEKYAIKDYPSPAGGCLLTDISFSRRLKRVMEYQNSLQIHHLNILKLGRHFYLQDNKLLVVGRNQGENKRMEEDALPEDILLKVAQRPGPLGLLRGAEATTQPDLIRQAASIVARYSDAKNEPRTMVKYYHPGLEEQSQLLEVTPLSPEEIPPGV